MNYSGKTSRAKRVMRRRTFKQYNREGFTLLELMLVMAILVVLASLGTVAYSRMQTGANQNAAKVGIKLLRDTCTMFKLQTGRYPNNLNDLVVLPSGMSQAAWQGPYLDEGVVPKDPWGQEYIYDANNAQDRVTITSIGADGQQGTADDIPNGANVK
jgi:general secretion pathway protein G